MKKSNKQIIIELCRFYKGEKENPYIPEGSNNRSLYWEYEKSYFDKPNVFQIKDIEEDFKNHMIQVIDKLSEHYQSFDKALKEYFETTP